MDLFTQGTINNLILKNRMIMSSIHLGYALDGKVNDRVIRFYSERARGGVAAIIVGGVAVEERGRLSNMISISDDSFVDGLAKLAESIKSNGCRVFVQLFHAGRNAHRKYIGCQPIAPSAIASPLNKEVPREMSAEDLQQVVTSFVNAAQRAKAAGFDGIEVSCSAGYLLSQFLSPLSNQRIDDYGGSGANRMRFPLAVVRAVKDAVGSNYPLILRISASDMLSGGYDLNYMRQFISALPKGQLDAIHVTGGWHEAPVPQTSVHLPPGGFAFFAAALKESTVLPVIASNRINDGEIANTIIAKGLADYVSVGRGLIADPELPNKIKSDSGPIRKCQACNQGCIDNIFKANPVCCMVNGHAGFECDIEIKKAPISKKILVVGGGVAGMEAARVAAVRGHKVTLCTEETELGGQLNVAAVPPYKSELFYFKDYLTYEIKRLGVEICYENRISESYIKEAVPDYTIIATGSKPLIPPIPGITNPQVLSAIDILKMNEAKLAQSCRGRIIIVGGGAVGLETAHYLAEQRRSITSEKMFIKEFMDAGYEKELRLFPHITVIEMGGKIGKDIGGSNRWILLKKLKELGVKCQVNSTVVAINKETIEIEVIDQRQLLDADTVIIAAGSRSDSQGLIKFLDDHDYPYSVIGDAKNPRQIIDAVHDAFLVAKNI